MSSYSSLYFHFPFCEARCHYCDFYALGRERTKKEDPSRFETALHQEVSFYLPKISSNIQTIFLGGGTPSMTEPSAMEKIFSPILDRVSENTEWTMEANPSSLSLEKLKAYRKLGINRISMGVQSTHQNLLTLLGRVHDPQRVEQCLEWIFESGFENVSVDLLCGVPNQSLKELESSLERLYRYPIQHLSCYLLTLHPTHRMFGQLPDENTQLEHLLFIDQWLTEHGFEHYEISNFCRPGFEAKHNLVYWKNESYLGLGPSSHSFDSVENKRWKNVSSLNRYVDLLKSGDLPVEEAEILTPKQLNLEKWMLALRLKDGFPESWLERPDQIAKAKKLEENGYLMPKSDHPHQLRLTPKGFTICDQIVVELA